MVSNEEIVCAGCSSHKSCTYGLVACTEKHGVEKCNQCKEFPYEKIMDMLTRSKKYRKKCKEVCSEEEYDALEKAFLIKRVILENKICV